VHACAYHTRVTRACTSHGVERRRRDQTDVAGRRTLLRRKITAGRVGRDPTPTHRRDEGCWGAVAHECKVTSCTACTGPWKPAHTSAQWREHTRVASVAFDAQKTTACAKGNSRREANKNVRTPAAGTYSRILIFKVKKRVTFPPHLSPNEDRWNVGTCRPTLVYAYVARARAYATTFSARTPRRTA